MNKCCPFCGKPAEARRSHYVACSDAGCFLSIDVHEDIWNNRPIEDDLRVALGAAREVIYQAVERVL